MGDTNRRTLFCFDHSNKRELALFTVWCGTACHLGLLKVNFKRHPPSGQTNYKKYLPPHPSGAYGLLDWWMATVAWMWLRMKNVTCHLSQQRMFPPSNDRRRLSLFPHTWGVSPEGTQDGNTGCLPLSHHQSLQSGGWGWQSTGYWSWRADGHIKGWFHWARTLASFQK